MVLTVALLYFVVQLEYLIEGLLFPATKEDGILILFQIKVFAICIGKLSRLSF